MTTTTILPVKGAPIIVGVSPLYIPLKPPDWINPYWLCNLVFNVSNGNNATSTTVPAIAPA